MGRPTKSWKDEPRRFAISGLYNDGSDGCHKLKSDQSESWL